MRISDWSSDVCSSDLLKGATTTTSQQSLEEQIAALVGSQTGNVRTSENVAGTSTQNNATNQLIQEIINAISQTNTTKTGTENTTGTEKKGRSEERRVGKEGCSTCRSRCSPYHSKKNTKIHNTLNMYNICHKL